MRFSNLALLSLLPLTLASPLPYNSNPPPTHTIPSQLIPKSTLEPKSLTSLNAFLALLLTHLPIISGSIKAVTGILTNFETLLALLTNEQTTYNELSGSCKPYTVIFARGTTEPGNVGILVGPPFLEALDAVVGEASVGVQGVNGYEAGVEGYWAGGDVKGSAEMAKQIEAAKVKCPNTKLIVSGYSQGGQLVHNAAKLISVTTAQWISKVIIFGDPLSHFAVANVPASKTKIFCNVGDNICDNGDLILAPHLLYGLNAVEAATFATS